MTGSPPTGFRYAPDRRPTSCTDTATAAGHTSPGMTTRHNGEGTISGPARTAATLFLMVGLPDAGEDRLGSSR